MKAKYEKELNKVNLHIETNLFYEEDYQMKMLRKNDIEGLAKVECQHVNGESVFIYDVSNTMSLRKKYELMELRYDDIYQLLEMLMRTVEEVQGYFLSPDGLVLDPSLIYWKKNKWSFLYLPVKKTNLNKAFHELTEYLVKTLDYKELEGIQLASFLHKETLQENFNLRDIIGRYEENYKKVVEAKKFTEEELSITQEYGGEILFNEFDEVDIEEANGSEYQRKRNGYNSGKKENEGTKQKQKKRILGKDKKSVKHKFRKSRWGDWGDLITD
jgi:hypothetical protein